MAQSAKIIDLTRSFVPIDPRAFPESMHGTTMEDAPEQRIPVVAYEGYNFMPTSYGYKSFFGTDNQLDLDALTSRVDKIFLVRTVEYLNIIVALCEDGIWTKGAAATGAWLHAIILPVPDPGKHYEWTTAVLGDSVLCYRASGAQYYNISSRNVYGAPIWDSAVSNVVVKYNQGYVDAGGAPADKYTFQLASVNADGMRSKPSPAFTVTTDNVYKINIEFTRDPTSISHRLYVTRDSDKILRCIDYNVDSQSTSSLQTIFLTAATLTTAVAASIPDLTSLVAKAGTPVPVTPNFLNMAGQLGIFKAVGRVGFWDSENSVSWSSLDDLSDFTPAIATLAGDAIFEDVQGNIVSILPHGKGFIIYATKSVVLIKQSVDSTFQWVPKPILNNSGIVFQEQAVVSTPDNTHYALTTTGLYKIVDGDEQIIIPEVTDYIKGATDPITLKILEGRYLALQVMDPKYISGAVDFRYDTIPAEVFTFPSDLPTIDDLIPPVTVTGIDVCYAFKALNNGAIAEHQIDGEAARVAAGTPPKIPGGIYQPLYTAYFSNNPCPDPNKINWVNAPCPGAGLDYVTGVTHPMAPSTDAGKSRLLGSNLTGRTAIKGEDAFVDGHWTIERFVQMQMAIWEQDAKNRAAYLKAILSRRFSSNNPGGFFGPEYSDLATAQAASVDYAGKHPPPPAVDCFIDDFISGDAGSMAWGFNRCSFWITRFITEVLPIYNNTSNTGGAGGAGRSRIYYTSVQYQSTTNPTGLFDNPNQMYRDYNGPYANTKQLRGDESGGAIWVIDPLNSNQYTVPSGETYTGHSVYQMMMSSGSSTFNRKGGARPAMIPDTGILTMSGWKYTDVNHVVHTIPATGTCTLPNPPAKPPSLGGTYFGGGDGNPIRPPIDVGTDGSICSIPFDPVTVPAIQPDPVIWETQNVVLPGGAFLLQNGSLAPVYPTYVGSLIYDMQIKKWGKLKLDYKQLLDYSPINSGASGIIPYEVFGMVAGALLPSGKVSLFDSKPADSYIKYGKIGYYRLGMTYCEEVLVHFRTQSTGQLIINTSLDGRAEEISQTAITEFTDADYVTATSSSCGRWNSVTVQGNYDIQYMEYRGTKAGRR